MSLLLNEDQIEFKDAVQSVLAKHASSQRVREVHDRGEGYDEKAWAALVELGAPATLVPEEYDGLGLGLTEASVLLEAAGRVIAPVPLHTALLGAAAVLATGDDALKQELLPAIASGESLVALAFTESADAWIPAVPTTVVSDSTVTGTKKFVRDGQFARHFLVFGSSSSGQPAVVLVDAEDPGVQVQALGVFDKSVFGARVSFESANARTVDVGDVQAFLDRVDSVASILLASAQLGAFERSLEITTQYAKDRFQFGRSIGSFQGVKHPLAEWATEVELAQSLLRHATAVDDADLRCEALAVQVKMQSLAFSGGTWMSRLHGGIGYTWDHDAHLYLKQAKTSQLLLGTPGDRKERLAVALGI